MWCLNECLHARAQHLNGAVIQRCVALVREIGSQDTGASVAVCARNVAILLQGMSTAAVRRQYGGKHQHALPM